MSYMPTVKDADIGGYLAGLMKLVLRASPSPLVIRQQRRGGYAVEAASGGAPVARFTREPDAELFIRALGDLRAQSAALVEVLGQHQDGGTGVCRQDSQPVPCTTRRILAAELGPRAATLERATREAAT